MDDASGQGDVVAGQAVGVAGTVVVLVVALTASTP